MEKLNPLFDLAGRIFMALLFIPAGAGKISGYAGTQGYMESVGVPGILLPLVAGRRASSPFCLPVSALFQRCCSTSSPQTRCR